MLFLPSSQAYGKVGNILTHDELRGTDLRRLLIEARQKQFHQDDPPLATLEQFAHCVLGFGPPLSSGDLYLAVSFEGHPYGRSGNVCPYYIPWTSFSAPEQTTLARFLPFSPSRNHEGTPLSASPKLRTHFETHGALRCNHLAHWTMTDSTYMRAARPARDIEPQPMRIEVFAPSDAMKHGAVSLQSVLDHLLEPTPSREENPLTTEDVRSMRCGQRTLPQDLTTLLSESPLVLGYRKSSANEYIWKWLHDVVFSRFIIGRDRVGNWRQVGAWRATISDEESPVGYINITDSFHDRACACPRITLATRIVAAAAMFECVTRAGSTIPQAFYSDPYPAEALRLARCLAFTEGLLGEGGPKLSDRERFFAEIKCKRLKDELDAAIRFSARSSINLTWKQPGNYLQGSSTSSLSIADFVI